MVEYAYIHIPFCRKKCKYCAFVSFVNLSHVEEYVNALIFEIRQKYNGTPLKTLYFGGGTPSLLKIEQVEKILAEFKFQNSPEITFELNPEDCTFEYLKNLKKIGITRLSLGVQTFDDEILSYIGRSHNSNVSIQALNTVFEAGFLNLSADIMYGLPLQTIDKLKKDMEILKQFNVPHISSYGLKIEEKTAFYFNSPRELPDDDVQADMYKLIVQEFSHFEHYEISNFAKNKTFISKHNYNYWKMNPYYGFGLGASFFLNNIRYKNTSIIKKYIQNPLLIDEKIEADLLEETIFLGFRTKEGININDINKKFNIDFEKKYEHILKKYLKSGHIKKDKENYSLTLDGVLISNYILCDFL